MTGVDMDLYALVANKILAERIAAQNAARVAASSIAVPRAPTAKDVEKRSYPVLAPGDLSKHAGFAEAIAGAPGWIAGKIAPYLKSWGTAAGEQLGKAQVAGRNIKNTLDKGFGQVRGAFEHGQRAADTAYQNIVNPITAAAGTPEHAAQLRRNEMAVIKAKRARKQQLKAKPPVGQKPGGKPAQDGGSLTDRAKEMLGAGAMLGYQFTGDGEEKTSAGSGRRARRLARKNARTAAGERKVPGAMPPPEEVAAAQAAYRARGKAMKSQRAAGMAAGVAPKPKFNTAGPRGKLPRNVKPGPGPGPAPVPPSGSLGGAASAGAAGAAGASPAPGDLSQHLKSIYDMTGSQWMSRGTKRLGALGSYMAQNHPIASAGIAGLGGLAAMYGARKLYRDFIGGGGEENRPKITIGM